MEVYYRVVGSGWGFGFEDFLLRRFKIKSLLDCSYEL